MLIEFDSLHSLRLNKYNMTHVDAIMCRYYNDLNTVVCNYNIYIYISDAPIMIFRGRFRYRFFSSKLADSDTDFFFL